MSKRIKLGTSYDTKELETFYSNGGRSGCGGWWGGGGGGLAPAFHTLRSGIPPPPPGPRLPYLAIRDPAPSFLDLPSLYPFFRLQNIDHFCVIFPISPSSPAALSSPASNIPPRPRPFSPRQSPLSTSPL